MMDHWRYCRWLICSLLLVKTLLADEIVPPERDDSIDPTTPKTDVVFAKDAPGYFRRQSFQLAPVSKHKTDQSEQLNSQFSPAVPLTYENLKPEEYYNQIYGSNLQPPSAEFYQLSPPADPVQHETLQPRPLFSVLEPQSVYQSSIDPSPITVGNRPSPSQLEQSVYTYNLDGSLQEQVQYAPAISQEVEAKQPSIADGYPQKSPAAYISSPTHAINKPDDSLPEQAQYSPAVSQGYAVKPSSVGGYKQQDPAAQAPAYNNAQNTAQTYPSNTVYAPSTLNSQKNYKTPVSYIGANNSSRPYQASPAADVINENAQYSHSNFHAKSPVKLKENIVSVSVYEQSPPGGYAYGYSYSNPAVAKKVPYPTTITHTVKAASSAAPAAYKPHHQSAQYSPAASGYSKYGNSYSYPADEKKVSYPRTAPHTVKPASPAAPAAYKPHHQSTQYSPAAKPLYSYSYSYPQVQYSPVAPLSYEYLKPKQSESIARGSNYYNNPESYQQFSASPARGYPRNFGYVSSSPISPRSHKYSKPEVPHGSTHPGVPLQSPAAHPREQHVPDAHVNPHVKNAAPYPAETSAAPYQHAPAVFSVPAAYYEEDKKYN